MKKRFIYVRLGNQLIVISLPMSNAHYYILSILSIIIFIITKAIELTKTHCESHIFIKKILLITR